MQRSVLRTATAATADICLTAAAISSAGDSWINIFLWLVQGHVEPEGGRWKGHKLNVADIAKQVKLQLGKVRAIASYYLIKSDSGQTVSAELSAGMTLIASWFEICMSSGIQESGCVSLQASVPSGAVTQVDTAGNTGLLL